MNKQICIGTPYLKSHGSCVRVCADLELNGSKETIWFSVDRKYGQYLVDDRCDAFVVGLLTFAMKDGADIKCDAPVSRRLLYQLRHYLIPILAANLSGYHAILLQAEPIDIKLHCAKAVATGWTGGVDCMYTLMKTLHAEESSRRLTHLMIANNGALESKDNQAMLKALVDKAEKGIASKLGLSVVGIDSNVHELVSERFLAVEAYRHAAVILSLQKLFSVYYNSGTYEYARFAFDADNCGYYEFVPLEYFSTDSTTFYSAYGSCPRWQKLKELSDYPLAYGMLHPCIYALPEHNCGKCGKCVRTMAALYGLGTLDRFSEVFDTEEFYRNKDRYIADVLAHKESQHYGEALALMKRRGIEPSPAAMRMARAMKAAKQVVDNRREQLEKKLLK